MPEDSSHPESILTSGGTYIAGNVYTGGGDFIARDKYEIHYPSLKDARARRDQLILLEKVRQFWIEGVLEKSLYQTVLLDLGMEARPDLIAHPWNTVIELPEQKPQLLGSGKNIAEIFNEADRSLLILGEPGAGKTITLLDLARVLIEKAVKEPTQPIPVILNLSSWGERRLPFEVWVLEELNTKYQIPKKLGQQWLADFDLLFLLDGLDEVSSEHQEACDQTINKFGRENGLSGIVVCSRVAEYTHLTTKLRMGGAVYLQPLTGEQVQSYFEQIGGSLIGLRTTLEKDPALQELARTPLMLSVMGFAYQDMPESAFQENRTTLEARREHIFDTYIRRMFARDGNANALPKEKVVKWLSWLAARQKAHNQTVFLIENLQPSWLDNSRQVWFYAVLSRGLGGLLLGLGLSLGVWGTFAYFGTLPLFGVVGGLIAGFVTARRFTEHVPSNTSTNESSNAPPIEPQKRKINWENLPVIGLATGLFTGGVIGAISFFSLFWFTFQDTLSDETPMYRFTGSILAGILGMIVVVLLIGGLAGFFFELIFGRRLRRQTLLADIHTVDALQWSWRAVLKTAPRGALIGTVLGPILGLPFGIFLANDPLDAILLIPLACCLFGGFTGVIGFLLGGVLGGMRGVAIPKKQIPNQGIWLTVRNSIIVGGVIVGLVGILNNLLSTPTSIGEGLANFRLGLFLGIVIVMFFGILDFIQHFVLRAMFWAMHQFPFRIVPFLERATDLIFLRKVGGGYIFVHRLLQEHFATMDVNALLKEMRE